MTDRLTQIRERLDAALSPVALEIDDESHLHAGHAGARDGRGHFRVMIVASAFEGLNRIKRHQLVYESVGEMMQTDIHALSIQAYSPTEI